MIDKAFILGNGPDRPTHHKWLNSLEGVTYGCNALYRDWCPDFLVANDWSMMIEIINSTYSGTCYFTDFEEFIDDTDHLDFKKIADEIDTLVIKKASGGLAYALGE